MYVTENFKQNKDNSIKKLKMYLRIYQQSQTKTNEKDEKRKVN